MTDMKNDPFISRGVNIAVTTTTTTGTREEESKTAERGTREGGALAVNCREKRTFEANGRQLHRESEREQ